MLSDGVIAKVSNFCHVKQKQVSVYLSLPECMMFVKQVSRHLSLSECMMLVKLVHISNFAFHLSVLSLASRDLALRPWSRSRDQSAISISYQRGSDIGLGLTTSLDTENCGRCLGLGLGLEVFGLGRGFDLTSGNLRYISQSFFSHQ